MNVIGHKKQSDRDIAMYVAGVASGFLLGSLFMYLVMLPSSDIATKVDTLRTECESQLPRDEKCVIAMLPENGEHHGVRDEIEDIKTRINDLQTELDNLLQSDE